MHQTSGCPCNSAIYPTGPAYQQGDPIQRACPAGFRDAGSRGIWHAGHGAACRQSSSPRTAGILQTPYRAGSYCRHTVHR